MTALSFDILWRDRGAERGMRELGKSTEKTGRDFKALKAVGVGAIAAIGVGVAKFGSQSVKAFVEAEGSQIRLQEAFRKFPRLADSNVGALERLNSQLALKTRFDDDATASGQAVLAQFKLTGSQITQLTPLLQDYAAKTGKDLPTAARDLGKAVMGQGRALKVVGLDLKDTGSQTGNLNQLMGGLRAQVGGFAEKEGKSAAGRAEILRNQFGELQEAAGEQLLPALLKVGNGALRLVGFIDGLSPVFSSFKRIAGSVFDSLSESVGGGTASFRKFGEYVMTHQADIVAGFSKVAKFALGIGKAVLTTASIALRGFAMIMDAQADMTEVSVAQFRQILRGATVAFGWIPGIGPRLKDASAKFDSFAGTALTGMRKAASGARTAADGIDNKLKPALDKAGSAMDRVSRKEIVRAQTRDAVRRAKLAVDNLGDSLNGGQIRLKRFSDRTKLSADEQAALRVRLTNAKDALRRQIDAMRDAHVGQDKLSAAWKRGRERLYDEFKQMGLSNREAKRLADRYAGIKPKVRTNFETPGLTGARENTRDLDNRINNLNSKRVSVDVSVNAQVNKLNRAIMKEYGRHAIKIALARGGEVPGSSPTATADDVDARLTSGEWVIKRPSARKYGPAAMAAVNEGRASIGYADGGEVRRTVTVANKLHGQTYDYSRLRDMGARASSDAGRAMTLALGRAASAAAQSAALAAARKQKAAEASAAPGGSGPTVAAGPGWGPIMAAMRRHGARSFTTYPAHHPSMAMARDVTPHNWAMANAAKALSSVWYVIYRMRIASKNHGNNWDIYRPTNFNGDWRHEHHVHVARRRDKGGVLRPGELAINQGGADERILSPVQTRAFERMVRVAEQSGRGGGGTVINVSFPNYVGDKSDLRRALVDMNRLGHLAVLGR